MLGRLAGNLAGTAAGGALGTNAGTALGTTIGLAAGGPVGAMIGGPIGGAVGGFTGGVIGGDVGKEVVGGNPHKRMAGERLELLKALAESPLVGPVSYNPAISTFNPNTQMGGMQGMDAFMGGMQQTHSY